MCKIVGISYRQLDYWARTDLVRPSLADARGSGTQRRYSYRDLVRLKVIKNLLDSGVSLQAARRAIEYLRDHVGRDLASAHLVLQGTSSLLAYTGDEIVDLLQPHRHVVEDGLEEVVGHGPWGLHALEGVHDGGRLRRTDEDRQVALPLVLAQQHDRLVRGNLDSNAHQRQTDHALPP